jgi:hypothetical protein
MGGRAKAEAMLGNIDRMTVAQLSQFVVDREAVERFLVEFKAQKTEFLNLVKAQADLDQIEKLLLQAKDERAAAAGETEVFSREKAKAAAEIDKQRREAKLAQDDAQNEARRIAAEAKAEAKAIMDIAAQARIDAKAETGQAKAALQEAEQTRDAADEILNKMREMHGRAMELVKLLGG